MTATCLNTIRALLADAEADANERFDLYRLAADLAEDAVEGELAAGLRWLAEWRREPSFGGVNRTQDSKWVWYSGTSRKRWAWYSLKRLTQASLLHPVAYDRLHHVPHAVWLGMGGTFPKKKPYLWFPTYADAVLAAARAAGKEGMK